jgi:hypothetical protein
MSILDSDWYRTGAVITFWLVFVVSWLGCIVSYGFLLGVGLGWLPSAIVGALAALLWPLLLALVVIVFAYLSNLHPH